MTRKSDPTLWTRDPQLIQRARIVLVLSLSKRSPGELVRIIMDRLGDHDLHEFCYRYLPASDLAYIEGERSGSGRKG